MKILIFFISLCLSSDAYTYSFYNQFPVEEKLIDGVSYPQNDRYFYSGTSAKRLNLSNAIKAMLGAGSIFYASRTFKEVQACLMINSICKKDLINYKNINFIHLSQVRRSKIFNLLINEKDLNGGAFESLDKASMAAKRILDKYFHWLGKDYLYSNFVKFKYTISGTNVETTNTKIINWPSETVYTSTLSRTSALYGPRIVIIKEKVPRSLDLGYWNFLNSGFWYETARDMGEFLAAGYIPGKDIKGYQIRKVTGGSFKPSKSKLGVRWQKEWHAIDYAFYLEKTNSGNIVVILKGDNRPCIRRKAAFSYEFCMDTIQSLIKPEQLKNAKDDPIKLKRLAVNIKKNPIVFPRSTSLIPALVGFFKLKGTKTPSEYKNYSKLGTLTLSEIKWLREKVPSMELSIN